MRKKHVRFHLVDRVTTIEGHLHRTTRRHYIVWAPKILESKNDSTGLEGYVEIPRDQVLFCQVLA